MDQSKRWKGRLSDGKDADFIRARKLEVTRTTPDMQKPENHRYRTCRRSCFGAVEVIEWLTNGNHSGHSPLGWGQDGSSTISMRILSRVRSRKSCRRRNLSC